MPTDIYDSDGLPVNLIEIDSTVRVVEVRHGLSPSHCFVCEGQLGAFAAEVTVFCKRCGPEWESRSTECCSEACAISYAKNAPVDEHETKDSERICVYAD